MEKYLNISKQYEGLYVALKDVNDPKVVGSGSTPLEALKEAEAAGYKDPVFFFVSEPNLSLIY
jgi:hypothetical protein